MIYKTGEFTLCNESAKVSLVVETRVLTAYNQKH